MTAETDNFSIRESDAGAGSGKELADLIVKQAQIDGLKAEQIMEAVVVAWVPAQKGFVFIGGGGPIEQGGFLIAALDMLADAMAEQVTNQVISAMADGVEDELRKLTEGD